jgi:ATP-binding cassette subfamily F protein uup
LLLDEPTNDLDVTTLGVLEETVLDHPGVAIVVSHDRAFLDRVCTGILAFERTMKDGREIITATPYVGDYTNYERLRAQKAGAPVPTVAPSQGPSSTSTPVVAPVEKRTAKRKRSYKEEQELQSIEARVLEAETKREALQAKLAQGDVFRSDLAEATRMSATVTTLDGEIERLYARWQELADLGAA